MSYANMDGVPTQTAGTSELLASDWNTYVRDNFDSIKFGHVVCTSSTRPTGIAEGTMIYETDTNKVLVYSGSAWVEISDLDSSYGLNAGFYSAIKNVQTTGNITTTTSTTSGTFVDATNMTVSITPFSASSKILIFSSVSFDTSSANNVVAAFNVVRNSTELLNRYLRTDTAAASERISAPVGVVYLDSPNTTNSVTYKNQIRSGNTSGTPSISLIEGVLTVMEVIT